MPPEHQPTESPCVGVCEIEPVTGYCRGCLRTLDEIAGWIYYSDEQRRTIARQLTSRTLADGRGATAGRSTRNR